MAAVAAAAATRRKSCQPAPPQWEMALVLRPKPMQSHRRTQVESQHCAPLCTTVERDGSVQVPRQVCTLQQTNESKWRTLKRAEEEETHMEATTLGKFFTITGMDHQGTSDERVRGTRTRDRTSQNWWRQSSRGENDEMRTRTCTRKTQGRPRARFAAVRTSE